MKTTSSLPYNYSKYTLLEPSKHPIFIIGAVVTGIALLLIFGWLAVLFVNTLRPSALDGMRLPDLFVSTTTGISLAIPAALFRNFAIALIAVLFIHELVHGLCYWLFSRQRPKFGFQGLFPYAAAPVGIYFPRKQFIAIGLAPLVLLTVIGLLLMMIVPIVLVPFFLFLVAFNAAGAAGDLIMVIQLMLFNSDVLMEDNDAGVIIYGPNRNAA